MMKDILMVKQNPYGTSGAITNCKQIDTELIYLDFCKEQISSTVSLINFCYCYQLRVVYLERDFYEFWRLDP